LKKLQSYYIFKLSTSRLKKYDYSINLTINNARKIGELVSIGDSQMLRSLRWIKGQDTNEEEITQLLLEKKRIKNRKYSLDNSSRLIEIDNRLDECLFVPEIISIFVENIKDYKKIGQDGFFVNRVKFVRLMCGAGQARRNNSLWVAEPIEKKLKEILNNDRKDIEIIPAKFSAYFSLSSSASLEVTTPYFCVVPDCEIVRREKVDFIREIDNSDDIVEECERDITFSLWDGMGLISPKFAQQWAFGDLGLDYIPSTFLIRANFIKGLLAVINFHEFSENIGIHYITDIWGNKVNIRDQDVILTQSQFKLFNAFDSIDDYVAKSKKNHLGWGITRVSPKFEDNHCFTNYQFDQVLNLDNVQIESFCSETVNYFESILKNNIEYTLLYLLGEKTNEPYDKNAFDDIHDNVTKALILNNYLINDPFVKNYLTHSLSKKIRESYIGNLIIDGQFSTIVADPYALLEHIFNLPINGLLARNEHYSRYWLDKKENKIAAMRAPLTWRSEINILNLKDNNNLKKWFKYLDKCIIYNIHGIDNMLQGGSDEDGDQICLTNSKEIINGTYGGLPIDYATQKALKCKINESQLYLSDINGFDSKVGFVTNVATSTFAMLPQFEENSKEYKELINRLKRFRKEQGMAIDSTKGLITKPFPVHWTKRKKISVNDTFDQIENVEFHNRIIINKRPIFMRFLYSHYNRRYLDYFNGKNEYCDGTFNKKLIDLIEQYHINPNILTIEEKIYIDDFYKYSPYLETDCIVNKISKYMQLKIKELKISLKNEISEKNIMILKNSSIPFDKIKYKQLDILYREYKNGRRNLLKKNIDGEIKFKNIDQYNKYIRQKCNNISNNLSELVNLAVAITYESHPNDSKQFLWDVFGDGLIENIKLNRQNNLYMPFLDNNGNISYLGSNYSMFGIELNNENELEEIDLYDYFE
jgi:hypothetical protein